MSPSQRASQHVAFDRALSNLRIARRFALHALESLPESATGLSRDAIKDARDQLDTSIEIIEDTVK